MEALINTQNDSVWFHKLIEPISQLLEENRVNIENDTAQKLNFKIFLTLLLYFYLKGIDTLRSLITDLNTNPDSSQVGLFPVGLSTIHDAFYRYPLKVFQNIYFYLLQSLSVHETDEFKELGRLILTDGSVFRMAISDFWADFRKKTKDINCIFILNLIKW